VLYVSFSALTWLGDIGPVKNLYHISSKGFAPDQVEEENRWEPACACLPGKLPLRQVGSFWHLTS